MKFYLQKRWLTAFFALLCGAFLQAQTVSGTVTDGATKEKLPGATVVVKGTTTGSLTDDNGFFKFDAKQKYPVVLSVSFVGFETVEITANDATPLSIAMGGDAKTIEVVEVKGQRISDKVKTGALTVESMDKLAIKQTASVSFYEGLGTLKGVDLTTASLGFTVINTRGFNSTSPVRSLQIIDGVDNQSPGLNFSLGNFLGSSELDVNKVDLVVGASSAFYGPNAFNGVLSMETKNPFFQRGLSAQVKTGERNLLETAVRFADHIKNKKGQPVMAYKLNFFRLQAYDWEADNFSPVYQTTSRADNPGRYDAVNRYGDERNASFDYTGINQAQPWNYVGLGAFHRTGYSEKDLVDYNVKNIKANAAVHFRLKPSDMENSPELILSSSYGNGTTVYQGDNRFSLRDISFYQNRLEVRKRDKWFFRVYATNEDAGRSFDPYFTALLMQERSKRDDAWGQHYVSYWNRVVEPQIRADGYPQLQIQGFDPACGCLIYSFDSTRAKQYIADNQDKFRAWHNDARNYSDTFNTPIPFLRPGTPAFASELERISTTKSSKRDISGGTAFFDRSALYHAHGEYKITPKKWVNEWILGANARLYAPNSEGTIFYDTAGVRITNFEYGLYTGIEKKFSDNRFKLNATLRMDKNQNFNFLFSPAASLVYQPDKLNYFRLSFSSAIRNPTLTDQYLFLNVGRAILAGNVSGANNLITVESFTDYINSNFNKNKLVYFNIGAIRPEKVRSLELGYRTTIKEKTYVDASYYFSFYNDFIGYQLGVRSDFDTASGFPVNIQAYRYAANASQAVTTQGFSIGIDHFFSKYYKLSGNYSWNVLNTQTNDPIIPAYNTPEHKFNIGISGRDVVIGKLENIGFSLNYKWIQGFLFQGSPQFTGEIPTYDLLDGQVSYTVKKINTTFKLGASNILDKRQFQTYGGPRIGRMAYLSLLYDFNKKD